MIDKADLSQWCLRFLDTVPAKPHFLTRLAIENATGILQNTSLKTQGVEKLIHHPGTNPLATFNRLITATSLLVDSPDDCLNLMAYTYVFSVLYQLVSRK